MKKKRRWLIESRFYHVGRGWGNWSFTWNRNDIFWDKHSAIMKLQEYKREETDTSEYRLTEELVDEEYW